MKSAWLVLCTALVVSPVMAADCGASCAGSNASATMSEGVGLVVSGGFELVGASGQFVVESVEKTADGLIIVVKASANATGKAVSTTVKLSGKAIKGLAVAAGEVVEVTALSTGYTLYYSGKAIAFIPTEAGKALVEHAKSK